jgi:2-methylcitrate dehydratase PrpD
MSFNRRAVLGGAVVGAGALAAGAAVQAQSLPPPTAPSPPISDVTATLARYIVGARLEDLPPKVKAEARRTLLNWLGCAIGGSRHETVDKAIAALSPFSGPREATVLGRAERLDILNAALVNGISSHIFDYDDTHLKTIIHPAGPVASAILALSQHQPITGAQFMNALVLGVETECRIGNAVWPSHYDMGWHITGSCGTFGSAAACAKLMGLDEEKTRWALGIAGSQPVGLKIQFGSMTKSFHPGRAAQNGLTAALLARQGYTAADAVLEGKDGWGQALSRAHDWGQVTESLGTRYEAALNTYKPFACGIVTHPGIDAAIQLRNENHLRADEIGAVELHANPLVLSLTGKTAPQTGLEGKFSIYHCIAVGLIYGAAGERQFQDAVVRDPAVIALRRKVSVRTDPSVSTEKSDLTIRLTDGQVLTRHIDNAIGSLQRPMSDQALEAKFTDLAQGILAPERIRRAMDLCWSLDTLPDAAEIARASAA